MAKRSLNILCSCITSFLVSALTITPTIYFNQTSLQSSNNIDNSINSLTSTSATTNKSSLFVSNRNSDYESPNGIVQLKKDANNQTALEFVSYFNSVNWTYNMVSATTETNKSILSLQPDFKSLYSTSVKYNPYSNTFFVYGTYITTNNDNKAAYLFQLDANTGREIIINNSPSTSLWVEKQYIKEIEGIVMYGATNSVLVIPKYEYWASPITNTILFRVNFSAYTSVWLKFKTWDIYPAVFDNNLNKNNNFKIGSIFELGDNLGRWGMTILDTTDPDTLKYKYAFFDDQIYFYGFSTNWETISTKNPSNATQIWSKNYGEISVADPVFYRNDATDTYTMIDMNVNPVTDSSFISGGNINATGSSEVRISTFTWNKGFNPTHYVNKTQLTSNGKVNYVYQFKKDAKHNLLYMSCYPYNAETATGRSINISSTNLFCFAITPGQTTLTSLGSVSTSYSFTGRRAILNFSVINDYHIDGLNPENASAKSSLVKEVLAYSTSHTSITIDTPIENIHQKRVTNAKDASGTWTKGNDIDWGPFAKGDYLTTATASDQINKLPGDVDETVIPNWITYTNGTTAVDYLTNSLENVTAPSGYSLSASGKIAYNNETGALKARVKSELAKWWYEKPTTGALEGYDKVVGYTDMEITGFATISSLMFKLVTSSEVEATKWDKINGEYLGKKLPSQLTAQQFLDDFIIQGNKLNVTISDIFLRTANQAKDNSKAIDIVYNDVNGTLTVEWNMTNKSSPGITPSYLAGTYTYTGFLRTSSYEAITLDNTAFTALKARKLAYEFTIEDMLKVVTLSDGYNTDIANWELQYTENPGTENYNNNLISGTTGFTFSYKRTNDIPSSIDDTKLKVTIDSTNGTGCKKLEDYIGGATVSSTSNHDPKLSGIYFDEKYANSLTGTETAENIDSKINNLISQTISIDLDWFNVNQFIPVKNSALSVDNKAVYDLTLKDDITSNIQITKDGITKQSLVISKSLQEKLKLTRPNMLKINFQDDLRVTFNYQSVNYNWNYDIAPSEGTNSTTVDFQSLVEKVNLDRETNKMELLPTDYPSASAFVDKYINNIDLFKKDFNLISNAGVKLTSTGTPTDPSYFEIKEVDMIANDQNGTVLVRYKLYYPNLTSSIEVTTSPEITITGFPSSSITVTILVVVVSTLLILLTALVIWWMFYINVKRNKKLYQYRDKYNKKSFAKIYKDKVVKN